jgi:hypothetical protein
MSAKGDEDVISLILLDNSSIFDELNIIISPDF